MSHDLAEPPERPSLQGYRAFEKLWESTRSRVWRAWRERDSRQVILKVTNEDPPKPERIGRFRHEYHLAGKLGGDGIPEALAFERLGRGAMLVLADNGGTACDQVLAQEGRLSPLEATRTALGVARILGHIHDRGIIHKDINTSNIVRNRAADRVEVIDLELASELGQEDASTASPTALEGTLAYIAPEQTGRMNRGVDYRADFYSLGASLFELLAGRPPFTADDPLALVHSHLAVTPPDLSELVPDVPAPLAGVVARLLAKTPEERYQSAAALIADLRTCWEGLTRGGTIPAFTPGAADISPTLQIPEKLYGRTESVTALQTGFERAAAGGRATCLVTGEPGIGKSALVGELYKPVTAHGAYFVSGKFDQLQRDRPYSALIQAFDELVRHILSESEDELAAWRARIQAALGPNGGVLAQLVPEIVAIIGEQGEPAPLDSRAERNRFNDTLRRFVGALASPITPLVLFLDDLQWADTASLALLRTLLLDDELGHFYLVGAYRDGEVDDDHPLRRLIAELTEGDAAPFGCHLTGLAEADVAQLIADTVNLPPDRVADLATQAYTKTLGNPFFLERLLARWADDGLLWADREAGHWRWDTAGITATELADNVVDLMAEKLRRLPSDTQHMLALAAVLGGQVDLADLAVVARETTGDVLDRLWAAIQTDVIRPIDNAYKYVNEAGHSGHAWLRFRHDRIQQAALDLLDREAYRQAQLSAGQLLLAQIHTPETDERLFDALGHLNAVPELIPSGAECQRVIQLNLVAGERAQRSAAYGPAQGFLETGIALLGNSPWQVDSALAQSLFQSSAEAAFMLGDLATMRAQTEAILAQTEDPDVAASARELRVQGLVFEGDPAGGIDEGLVGLAQLRLKLPAQPGKATALAEALRTRRTVAQSDLHAQAERGEITDRRRRAIMRLLAALLAPAYRARPTLFPILVMRQVRLALHHGNHPSACYAFAAYGLLLIAMDRSIAEADRFGRLAQAVLELLGAERYRCAVDFVVCNFIDAWQQEPDEIAQRLNAIHDEGLRTGDLNFAAYAVHTAGIALNDTALPLSQLTQSLDSCLHRAGKIGQSTSLEMLYPSRQFSQQVYEVLQRPDVMAGPYCDAASMAEQFRKHANYTGLYNLSLMQLWTAYHYQVLNDLEAWQQTLRRTYDAVRGSVGRMRGLTLDVTVAAARIAEGHSPQPQQELRSARRRYAYCQRVLARLPNPERFQVNILLAQAELRRAEGRYDSALASFENLIVSAETRGKYEFAGLARERAARLQEERGLPRLARAHIQEALGDYAQWEAHGKIAFLQRRYGLLGRAEAAGTSTPANSPDFTRTVTSEGEHDLDLEAVMRAAQTISQEIRPARLAETLMRVVGQTAGATHGCLLLGSREAELQAQAILDTDADEDVTVFAERPTGASPVTAEFVPVTVARHSLRRREPVAIDHPEDARSYRYDPYIQAHRPAAVLCLPLVNQGRVTGLLYVEHRSMAGAFPQQRSTVLSLLSAQMAVSLENAQLYSDMEAQVAARTHELEQTAEALRQEKAETDRAHQVIHDSLETARRMQRAALPEATAAELGLADLACVWQPRDQVGGDFYRVAQDSRGSQVALVVMDCTGHGVPGALLSFVATSAADRALQETQDWDPAELLQRLDRLVRSQLHGQMEADPGETDHTATDDGLEAAVCVAEPATGRLRFAGAGIHLFTSRTGSVAVTRGARGPLGYRTVAAPSGLATTELDGGADAHFLTTDGILEQTGGPKGLQLARKRFAQILADTRDAADLAERTRRIREAVEVWQGNEPQRDDLTLIGLRLSTGSG